MSIFSNKTKTWIEIPLLKLKFPCKTCQISGNFEKKTRFSSKLFEGTKQNCINRWGNILKIHFIHIIYAPKVFNFRLNLTQEGKLIRMKILTRMYFYPKLLVLSFFHCTFLYNCIWLVVLLTFATLLCYGSLSSHKHLYSSDHLPHFPSIFSTFVKYSLLCLQSYHAPNNIIPIPSHCVSHHCCLLFNFWYFYSNLYCAFFLQATF